MKTRIPSTVIIAVLVLINMFFMTALLGTDLNFSGVEPQPDDAGISLLWGGMVVGVVLVFLHGWAIAIALTHAICLIVTVRNRKSPLLTVRIINLVLDAANVFLIVAPIVQIMIWRASM